MLRGPALAGTNGVGHLLRCLAGRLLHGGGLDLLAVDGIVRILHAKTHAGGGHPQKRRVLQFMGQVEVGEYLLHFLALLLQALQMRLQLLLLQRPGLLLLPQSRLPLAALQPLGHIHVHAHLQGFLLVVCVVVLHGLCQRRSVQMLHVHAMALCQQIQRRSQGLQRTLRPVGGLEPGLNGALHLPVVLRILHDLLPSHALGGLLLGFFALIRGFFRGLGRRFLLRSGGLLRLGGGLPCRHPLPARPVFLQLFRRNAQFQQFALPGVGSTVFARCGCSIPGSGTCAFAAEQLQPNVACLHMFLLISAAYVRRVVKVEGAGRVGLPSTADRAAVLPLDHATHAPGVSPRQK